MKNIESVLTELCIPFRAGGQHQHVTVGWIGIDCPFCSPGSGKFKLGINVAGGFCSCWTCGGKHLDAVLESAANTPRRDVLQILKRVSWKRATVVERPRGALQIPRGVGDLRR